MKSEKSLLRSPSRKVGMHISKQKKWLFGAFLVTASNRYVARRAYDFLIEQCETGPCAGILNMDTGEIIRWTRFSHFEQRESVMMNKEVSRTGYFLPSSAEEAHADL